jgi:hypothetical protein
VVLGMGVEQPSNHAPVLRMVLTRFDLDEIDAALAQRDGDLGALIAKDKRLGRRKEVRNDPIFPNGSSAYLILSLVNSLAFQHQRRVESRPI